VVGYRSTEGRFAVLRLSWMYFSSSASMRPFHVLVTSRSLQRIKPPPERSSPAPIIRTPVSAPRPSSGNRPDRREDLT